MCEPIIKYDIVYSFNILNLLYVIIVDVKI
jgi:hypothetical protein